MICAFHTGDAGDVASALPIIRHLGGGEMVIGPHIGPGAPREPMTLARARFIMPLIEQQSYITNVCYEWKPARITHDFSYFRVNFRLIPGECLTHWHGRSLGIKPEDIDLSPWLMVEPSPETEGRVVIARSSRYHTPTFPWRELMQQHGSKAVFVGLPAEHEAFTKEYGAIPYREVRDALEMAQLIAGAQLFIGNQSCPCWIAMGLGQNLIQETYPWSPNSRIVRPNACYATSMAELFMHAITANARLANK